MEQHIQYAEKNPRHITSNSIFSKLSSKNEGEIKHFKINKEIIYYQIFMPRNAKGNFSR